MVLLRVLGRKWQQEALKRVWPEGTTPILDPETSWVLHVMRGVAVPVSPLQWRGPRCRAFYAYFAGYCERSSLGLEIAVTSAARWPGGV